jgi:16S rRNA (guanine966-N2)-methyltransferase
MRVRQAEGVPRIIAGWAGSLQLRAPTSGTRPTSDRVREAIFSALEAADALRDARVLDLYAGSGALGLEAVSRGAASAVLVDKAGGAATVLRQNVALLKRAAPGPFDVTVQQRAVPTFLTSAAEEARTVDLVFLDPPYALTDAAVRHDLAALQPLLSPGATVVLERSSRSAPLEPLPDGLVLTRIRTYGDTAVHLLTTA